MNLRHIRQIPGPDEILEQIPFPGHLERLKAKRDASIRAIFEGSDKRFLLIIGPCSADHPDPVFEYLSRLASVQAKVAAKILMIPRIYTNKPRTTGEGYKGMFHQPDPEVKSNLL
jgi:3-deoxy-7-phosphoheptulonate synthase